MRRGFERLTPEEVREATTELFESPSRRGYGPQGRGLAPVERLTFAAMELLDRDDELVTRIEQLAEERPACPGLSSELPTRFVVRHGYGGDHPACRQWLGEVIRVCKILGCPSLDAILSQMVHLNEGLRPGQLRATRVRRPEGDLNVDSTKRPRGTINRPARDLLSRRAYGAGGLAALRSLVSAHRQRRGLEARDAATWGSDRRRHGWRTLALELEDELKRWRAGETPIRRDITYPTWQEWHRSPRRREGLDRDWVEVDERIERADEMFGRYLQRRAAKINKLLDAELPLYD